MTELTRREIASLTGLPTSTLTRHLRRFPLARSGRGRFTTADSGFAAWLARFEGRDSSSADLEAAYDTTVRGGDGLTTLPSGVLLPWEVFDLLRTGHERDALEFLDEVIRGWALKPHPAVPDRLRRKPIRLPSGTVVNGAHWSVFRTSNTRRARYALDVLLRSFGGHAA